MKVLIFGAHGQIGRELMTVPTPPGMERIGFGRGDVDIADELAVKTTVESHRPDVIINAAAYTAVDAAEDDRQQAIKINATGAQFVAEASQIVGANLIHLSTDFVFDGQSTTPYVESAPVNPICVYGESKEIGERRVRKATDRHFVIRTSWVFGHHGRNFVKTILELLGTRDQLSIINDQTGCPTEARDIATALIAIAERTADGAPFGTYHFSGIGAINWHDFACEIAQLKHRVKADHTEISPTTTADYGQQATRPPYSVLDCHLISQKLRITPPSWRPGLERVVNQWLTENE